MTVKLTWLGHACVKLEHNNKVILIDPWISNPKFPGEEFKPNKIDLILVTHGHNDHMGEVIPLAKEFNPKIVAIHELGGYLTSQGIENVVGMNFGGTYDFDGIKISMVPALHSGGYATEKGMLYMGAPAGFVITFTDGNSFYHCGDTGVSKEMEITRDLFSPSYGLLAIGGHYTMDPRGAAYAAKMMKLKRIFPIHWGTFIPPLTGTPEELELELEGSDISVEKWIPGTIIEF